MIITTGHNIEGYEIVEYLDVLTAEYAFQTTYLKGFFSKELFNVDNALGTISKGHTGTIATYNRIILKGLMHQAQEVGADGIISVAFQFSSVTNDFVVVVGTGTAVKIKNKSVINTPNDFNSQENAVPVNQNNLAQPSPEQIDEKMPIEYSENCIQILEYIVKNIEQFKNTQEIKDYYLKTVKSEDIDASLVQSMDKRIALERMYGSMKYDTKKDIEKVLGNSH